MDPLAASSRAPAFPAKKPTAVEEKRKFMTCVPMTTSPGAAAPERAQGRNGPRLTWREPGRGRFEVSLIITRGTTGAR